MTRLTEEMVIARTKVSNLSLIKKFNCCGFELTDISILKRMRGVEVVSLSVNKIKSLQPFGECQKLQELYVRNNDIQDINEIAHLKNLASLKFLWLGENPCCKKLGTNYRVAVLRALPNLKKLDNIDVTEEEVNDALRSAGDDRPGTQDEDSKEDVHEQQQQQHQIPPQVQYQHQQQQASQRGSNQIPPQVQCQQQQASQRVLHQSQHTQHSSGRGPSSSPTKEEQIHPTSPKYNQNTREHRMSLPQADIRAPFMREHYQSERPHHPPNYRQNQTDLTEWDEHPHAPHHNPYGSSAALHHTPEQPPYHNGSSRENGEWEEPLSSRQQRSDIQPPAVNSAAFSQYAPVHRRPVSRSSNLLSAALCLVKDLDYASLEVLERSVLSRIQELSNE